MQELVDVVDENDVVIGRASRKEVHSGRLLHRVVRVLVLDPKKGILLTKRGKKKDVFPGFWEATIAGHVCSGESYVEAALRELKEELGISAKAEELKELFKFKYACEEEVEMTTVFVLEYRDEKIRLDRAEAEACEFISLDGLQKELAQMKRRFSPPFVEAFERLLRQKNKLF